MIISKSVGRHTAVRPSTEDAILNAAGLCFDRTGVKGTTMDDIVVQSGVSRATLYRYFSSKEAIVDRISALEAERIKSEIRGMLRANLSVGEVVEECLFFAARIASQTRWLRELTSDAGFRSRAADPDSPQHAMFRSSWSSFIDRAMASRSFAPDLSEREVDDWLFYSLSILLAKVEAENLDDAQLRRFIARFLVKPLLP